MTMFYDVYRTPGPPLTRWQNAICTVKVCAFIALWAIGALITRNGDWLDKYVSSPDRDGGPLPRPERNTP